jgi:hypothetical protein
MIIYAAVSITVALATGFVLPATGWSLVLAPVAGSLAAGLVACLVARRPTSAPAIRAVVLHDQAFLPKA